jgi:hypothetical protein
MNTWRWLLPFTHAVDMQAIDIAVRLAEHNKATLVALSLLTPSQERPGHQEQRRVPRIRLECIQESKDFLEAVRWKAIRRQVAVECHEILTEDVSESIAIQVQELGCQWIVLTRHGTQEALLSAQEKEQVLMNPPAALLFLALPERRLPGLRLYSGSQKS